MTTAPAAERGTTTIADAVVVKVASGAVRGVGGVHATRRVDVEVGAQQAAVAVELVADHGTSLPAVAGAVRRAVSDAVQGLTGLRVTAVDVLVSDVHVPAPASAPASGPQQRHLPPTRTTAR